MNWGPCESQSPTGKSQERDGAKGKKGDQEGGPAATVSESFQIHCLMRFGPAGQD